MQYITGIYQRIKPREKRTKNRKIMYGVRIKEFKTREQFEKFWNKNQKKYQMTEVFINNAYGIEYKPLLKL